MTPELREQWRREPLMMQHALWPQFTFYDKQIEIIHSVRDNKETVVVAGNQLGKDFVAGFIVLWFFLTHYQVDRSRNWCRCVTTSVKAEHLGVLWAEIGRFIACSAVPLTVDKGGPLVINDLELRYAHEKAESGNNVANFVRGEVCGKNSSAGLQGKHAEHTLVVIDEASGVEQWVYDMVSTWAKRFLIIGNPWPCRNFFYTAVKEGDILL